MVLAIVRRCLLLVVIVSGYVCASENVDDFLKNASKEDITLQITQEYDRLLADNSSQVREHLFKLYVVCSLGGFFKGVSRAEIKEAWNNRDVLFFAQRIPAGLLGIGEIVAVVSKMWDRYVINKTRDEITRAIDREFAMRELIMKSEFAGKSAAGNTISKGLSADMEQEDGLPQASATVL
ncbi:TPA: hypothetical protein DDZ86_01905 [Candidatus Dependentiae bacterium]|nr:MAG: hypothetical protein UW09_C0001G0255 [candidate division TM6 bacterium GW2011_GWF2_43_87]HBL98379.1 hypothetical protein [Candidatus Dependentiae bacterium]